MSIAILGLNFHHADSSACLVIDGNLIAAIAEERLTRSKRDSSFPKNAIKKVLEIANIDLKDLNYIAYSKNENANLIQKIRYGINNLNTSIPAYLTSKKRSKNNKNLIKKICDALGESFGNKLPEVIKVEHHLAHACSSYFNSNFDESLIFNSDGSGDFVSMSVFKGFGNKLQLLEKIFLPNSLGMFYTAVTQLIGFPGYGDEFKLMGLSAYGTPKYYEEMKKIFKIYPNGNFKLKPGYIKMHSGGESGNKNKKSEVFIEKMYTDKMVEIFGEAPKDCKKPTTRESDLAASAQKIFEEITLSKLSKYKRNSKNICLAGGCSLNGCLNTKIYTELDFKSQFVQPASTDDGTAVGAAFYVWNIYLSKESRFFMNDPYLGGQYKLVDSDLEKIKNDGFHIKEHSNFSKVINSAASSISSNEVIGWFQDRSEWGPRALGNRSILTNPANPDAKEIINKKIKRRESYRPFAPSVIEEELTKFFKLNLPSPFMNHVFDVKEEYRNILKAITHVDGSARVQTINKKISSKYHQLITEVGQRTGYPMVLNTSFNENEPIVENPMEAFNTFKRTDMDKLYVENYEISK